MPEGLAIYVHWPFCSRICPYCDFNVYKKKDEINLIPAILTDLSFWREWTGPRSVTSIHFGGGTPSLMSAEDIYSVISRIKSLWNLKLSCEITLEANPVDMNKGRWEAYAKSGVNRLSLGVQSFYDIALKNLGRDHNSAEAKSSIELAKNIFPSVSIDLIFGWKGQDERLLHNDITEAIKSGVDHISTYQLTIEEGTAFHKSEIRGNKKSVTPDQSADFYDTIVKNLIATGFEHYEVSNFAKPSHQSRHNLTYWKGLDYVGVGPGAHGRVTLHKSRYSTISKMRPQDYIQNIELMGHGLEIREKLSPQEWSSEYIIMGLRVDNGISIQRYEELSGQALPKQKINNLVSDGFLLIEGDVLSTSRKGRNVLDHITREILI